MAARNPTDFNASFDIKKISPGREIRSTIPNIIENNQHYMLDQQELVISDFFYSVQTGATAIQVVGYSLVGKDLCGDTTAAGTTGYEFTFYVEADIGSTGTISVTTNVGTYTTTFTNTSWAWTPFLAVTMDTDNTLEDVTIQLQRTAGAGNVRMTAIGAFALET